MVSSYQINSKKSEIRSARAVLSSIEGERRSARAQINRLDSQIADAFEDLADFYLPGFTKGDVENVPVNRLKNVADDYFSDKQNRIAQLDTLIDSESLQLNDLEFKVGSAEDELGKVQAENAQLLSQYESLIAEHDEYQGLLAKKNALQAELAGAKSQYESRLESKRIGQAAITDKSTLRGRVFNYFVDKGVLESNGKNKSGHIDRKLANYFNFADRMEKFDTYDALVWESSLKVERLQSELEALVDPMEDIEDIISDEIGLSASDELVDATSGKYQRLVVQAEKLEDNLRANKEERAELDVEEGRYYTKAITEAINILSATPMGKLMQDALETPDPRDDGIVRSIMNFQEQIQLRESEIVDIRQRERRQDSIISSLENERRSLQRRYDEEQAEEARRRAAARRRRRAARSSSYGGGGGSFSSGGFGGGSSATGGW